MSLIALKNSNLWKNLTDRVNQQETRLFLNLNVVLRQRRCKRMNKDNNIELGSSETTREAFVFNFDQFIASISLPTSAKQLELRSSEMTDQKRAFLEWFLGFTEGDGSFALTKSPTLQNPKNVRPSFRINQKHPQVLYKIKKELGFGTIIFIKDKDTGIHYYRYSVYTLRHIKVLIQLFNGNLLLNKVQTRFANWINAYNTLCDQRDQQQGFTYQQIQQNLGDKITLKQSSIQLDFNSAWFTGFVDAEGGFYASLSCSQCHTGGFRQRYKFYLPQKGELQLLQRINALVQAASHANAKQPAQSSLNSVQELRSGISSLSMNENLNTKQTKILKNSANQAQSTHIREIKKNVYRLELTRLSNLEALIDYFDKYPLLTKKKLMFIRWKRVILRRNELKRMALVSQKGMKRYKNLYASVGKIREAQYIDHTLPVKSSELGSDCFTKVDMDI